MSILKNNVDYDLLTYLSHLLDLNNVLITNLDSGKVYQPNILTANIKESFENKEKYIGTCTDLSSAFDSVNRQI